jgi:UDP-3-O-[3-hydroxymyristoyl] glucosamine N-acyltransferase
LGFEEILVTVGELIERLGGELLSGDSELAVTGVAEPASAGRTDVAFADNVSAVGKLLESSAGVAVVPVDFVVPSDCVLTVIGVKQPRLWFARAAKLLARVKVKVSATGIHPSSVVAVTSKLGEGISIGPGAVVGDLAEIGDFTRIDAGAVIGEGVRIGEHCRIYPRVVIYPGTAIQDWVIVHAGAVLGADGFGYVRDRETGAYTQFPQQGRLVVEDDVEIGANTTIDRGALSETRIRRGTKIDNLVHIGHNCDIGEDVVIASQTGISGSSTVGNGAVLAGQVGIGDHAHVGPGVILGGQAGVLSGKTLTATGTVLWGTPAKPLREYLRELATLSRLARRKKD